MTGACIACVGWRTLVAAASCAALMALMQSSLLGSDPQEPTFKAGTTLVEVSAIVTRDGVTVADLSRDEVQVLDDGVPQALVAFEYVDLSRDTEVRQRRDFVLVLDELQIDPRQTTAVTALAERMIAGLAPSDRLAIVNTGPFPLVQQLSTDRQAARSLTRRFRAMATQATDRSHAAIVLLTVIRNVARVLARDGTTERRAVLVVSGGGTLGFVAPDGRDDVHPELRAYDQMVAEAAVSNVAVYCVNPRGLDVPLTVITGATDQAVAEAASQLGAQVGQASATSRLGLLWRMSDVTGGTLVANRNDLGAGLAGMFQDSRQYYRLGYVQPPIAPGGERNARRIEVRVTRPDTTVRARKAYLPK